MGSFKDRVSQGYQVTSVPGRFGTDIIGHFGTCLIFGTLKYLFMGFVNKSKKPSCVYRQINNHICFDTNIY